MEDAILRAVLEDGGHPPSDPAVAAMLPLARAVGVTLRPARIEALDAAAGELAVAAREYVGAGRTALVFACTESGVAMISRIAGEEVVAVVPAAEASSLARHLGGVVALTVAESAVVATSGQSHLVAQLAGGEILRLIDVAGERLANKARLAAEQARTARARRALAARTRDLDAANGELRRVLESLPMRALRRYQEARDSLLPHQTARRRIWAAGVGYVRAAVRLLRPDGPEDAYAVWIARHEPRPPAHDDLASAIDCDARIDVTVLADGAQEDDLRRTAASVLAQSRPQWALRLVGGGTAAANVAEQDARVSVAPAAASLGASLSATRGDFVAAVGPGETLAPGALASVAQFIGEHPDVDVIYTDEDRIEGDARVEPRFKPDWSPDLLLSTDYIGGLVVYRRSVVDPAAVDPYDLALRVTERTERVAHLPLVLLHRSAPRAHDELAERQALERAAQRRDGATIEPGLFAGAWRYRRAVRGEPFVSIIIPTRNRVELLRPCLESIEAKSSWRDFEVLVVDNGSDDAATLQYLSALPARHRVVRDPRPFNWSGLNNAAARQARGEFLLFLNNDIEVVEPDWIQAMLEHAQRPEVGAVGAKLLYPDRTVQHAGVVVGIGGVAAHGFRKLPGDAPGYLGLAAVVRDVTAVTGACLMTRREQFDKVGGFDEAFPVAFNDVDYCLRLRERGLLVVWTPHALLLHHESASRGPSHPPEDEALLRGRWARTLALDPYYSPHLTHVADDYGIRR